MINSKKLLSLFLAVVMVLSAFSVMAFAYTGGPEKAGDINYKYTVEKVDTVPETEAGSAEYSADNIYAVTVWMSSNLGVDNVTAPIHYNKAHFPPIVLFDGESTYPQGAGKTADMEGMTQDNYYEYMGEGNLYAYALGDYMNNTGMYKANGTTATTKALAKCIGLGNKNSDGVSVTAELVSPDHPLYSKWGAGLPANTGVMYVNLDVVAGTKTAYLNTISGVNFTTDWVNMFTVYFETLDGVTDADVAGDEFGVYTDNCFTVDGTTDENGLGYYDAATSITGNPNKNVVSNAVVEAAAPAAIVKPMNSQIRFDKDAATGKYVPATGTFDIRTLAEISAEDFKTFGATDAEAQTNIVKVGFVYAAKSVVANFDVATAKAVAEGGSAAGYAAKDVDYISKSYKEGSYVFSCMVTDIPDASKADDLNVLAYVAYNSGDGVVYEYFADAYAVDITGLYSRNVDKVK